MSSKWLVRLGLVGSSVVGWMAYLFIYCSTSLAVGAGEVTQSGWMAQGIALITSSGLTLASVVAFLKEWGPTVIKTVSPNTKLPDLNDPTISKEIEDAEEIALAVAALLKDRTDKTAQRRFALAAVTELSDLAELKSPTIASAINNLGNVMANRWFPAPVTNATQTPATAS